MRRHYGGAEPAELPKERNTLAGEEPIVSGMAGRYATALFDLALEQNALDEVTRDLARFDAMVDDSPDFARLVRSPVFTPEDQAMPSRRCWPRPGSAGWRRISSRW